MLIVKTQLHATFARLRMVASRMYGISADQNRYLHINRPYYNYYLINILINSDS